MKPGTRDMFLQALADAGGTADARDLAPSLFPDKRKAREKLGWFLLQSRSRASGFISHDLGVGEDLAARMRGGGPLPIKITPKGRKRIQDRATNRGSKTEERTVSKPTSGSELLEAIERSLTGTRLSEGNDANTILAAADDLEAKYAEFKSAAGRFKEALDGNRGMVDPEYRDAHDMVVDTLKMLRKIGRKTAGAQVQVRRVKADQETKKRGRGER